MLAGIADARAQHNSTIIVPPGKTIQDDPNYIPTDDAYFTQRIFDLATKYAQQFGYDPNLVTQKQAELTTLQTKLANAQKLTGA
jgi:hypothetical protein